ncbi:MAG: FAD-dependent oxidoreductase [Planctomycetaceae bacterium]|nr:FAD-dependent oxidoreductase [Planctomycetaceae bacterium]
MRVQPACSMMGQAAGTAAVQSIKTGQPANDLDTEMLVLTLRKAGAYLPQDSLTKKMTRNET